MTEAVTHLEPAKESERVFLRMYELELATREYEEARRLKDAASRRETDAINAVNTLQREVDAAISAFREKAPSGTDWHRRSRANLRGGS